MADPVGGVERFGDRGKRLWDALSNARAFNAAEVVMLEELCRIADRLEQCDRLLSRDIDAWASIESAYRGGDRVIELTLDDSLAEARQQAATFQRLAAALNLPAAKAAVEDGIGDLARKRAERLASG